MLQTTPGTVFREQTTVDEPIPFRDGEPILLDMAVSMGKVVDTHEPSICSWYVLDLIDHTCLVFVHNTYTHVAGKTPLTINYDKG